MDALLFLAVPGDAGTISFDKNVTLDTDTPFVRSVYVTSGDGVYGTGDTIDLVCLFSQPVVVAGEAEGTPSIGLSLGRLDKSARAVYSGGNGTAEFELSYTVRSIFYRWYQSIQQGSYTAVKALHSVVPVSYLVCERVFTVRWVGFL